MIRMLLMALLLAEPKRARAGNAHPRSVRRRRCRTIVGQRYADGVTIARIFAEDRTLVIVLDGPPGWRDAMTADQVSSIFVGEASARKPDFDYFVDGNTMRIDTTVGRRRRPAPGPLVRACSRRAGTQ